MDPTIWLRPHVVTERRRVYQELEGREEIIRELKEKVFLPSSAYPRRRGPKPKYDFLWVSIAPDIGEDKAQAVAEYLRKEFNRHVVYWPTEIITRDGPMTVWRFVLGWRDPETGKSIRTGKGVFKRVRYQITNVLRGLPPDGELPEGEPILGGSETKKSSQDQRPRSDEIFAKDQSEEIIVTAPAVTEDQGEETIAQVQDETVEDLTDLEEGTSKDKNAKENELLIEQLEELAEIENKWEERKKIEERIKDLEETLRMLYKYKLEWERTLDRAEKNIRVGFFVVTNKRRKKKAEEKLRMLKADILRVKEEIKKLKG